jgi:hypothetical protein
MRNGIAQAAALALLSLAGCGSQTPCSGTGCLQVGGAYLFVLGEQVNCPIWEKNVPPSSVLTITQNGSSLSATFWPDTDDPHTLTGTLYSNNSMTLAESTQNELLGIPYATVNATFTSTAATAGASQYFLSGQIFLQGPGTSSSGGAGAGGGLGCTGGTTTITAQEQAGLVVTDAGTVVIPDAGNVGDGG